MAEICGKTESLLSGEQPEYIPVDCTSLTMYEVCAEDSYNVECNVAAPTGMTTITSGTGEDMEITLPKGFYIAEFSSYARDNKDASLFYSIFRDAIQLDCSYRIKKQSDADIKYPMHAMTDRFEVGPSGATITVKAINDLTRIDGFSYCYILNRILKILKVP